jgi:hypothetical protein
MLESAAIAQSAGRGGTFSEMTRDTITCAAIGTSIEGADDPHPAAIAAQPIKTQGRTLSTRNEYRRVTVPASAFRDSRSHCAAFPIRLHSAKMLLRESFDGIERRS